MGFSQFVCLFVTLNAVVFGRLNKIEGEVCKEENGKKWVCKTIADCQFPLKVLEDERQEPPFCKFNGSDPIVCCDPDFAAGKSNDMCNIHAKAVLTNLSKDGSASTDTCADGTSNSPLSGNAKPRKYPHVALIGSGNESSIKWNCVGSLISDQFVLGTAFCSNGTPKPKWVRLGVYNRNSDDGEAGHSQSVIYEIKEVIIHPEFKPPNVYNDIALYKLKEIVEFNEYIRPTCLQKGHEIKKENLIVTGWGRNETGGRKNYILQDVKAKVISVKKCKEYFKQTDNMAEGIREDAMICAGDILRGGDVCLVESGGLLIQSLEEPYCMHSLAGIASFGHVGCEGPAPGVYTRVSTYVPWIEAIVWP